MRPVRERTGVQGELSAAPLRTRNRVREVTPVSQGGPRSPIDVKPSRPNASVVGSIKRHRPAAADVATAKKRPSDVRERRRAGVRKRDGRAVEDGGNMMDGGSASAVVIGVFTADDGE